MGKSQWRGGRRFRSVHFCALHSQWLPKTVTGLRPSSHYKKSISFHESYVWRVLLEGHRFNLVPFLPMRAVGSPSAFDLLTRALWNTFVYGCYWWRVASFLWRHDSVLRLGICTTGSSCMCDKMSRIFFVFLFQKSNHNSRKSNSSDFFLLRYFGAPICSPLCWSLF